MMLTELYYYSKNHRAAKAASRRAGRFSPIVRCDAADPVLAGAAPPRPGLMRADVLRPHTRQRGSVNCARAVISAADLGGNREPAPQFELPLDKQSRNQLTGTATKTRDGPRLGNAKPPLTRPRRYPMAELSDHTFFPSSAHSFGAPPELAADELIDALEAALRRVTTLPADASPPLVDLAHSTLAALARIRSAGHLACITWHVARELRLRPDDLQSASREQRITFARQVAMFLCRKLTGAPFESIGQYFNRDHSTVIHAYQLIERRTERGAGFRLAIEKLEAQITTAAARGATWHTQIHPELRPVRTADAAPQRFSTCSSLGCRQALSLGLFHQAHQGNRQGGFEAGMSATLKASPIEAEAVRLAEIAHQWRLDRQQIEDWVRHESEREWRRRQ
jgi:Bacterial dnaA protein helix-turn-helix